MKTNDLTRRLLNTSESLGMNAKVKVVDMYSQKLTNSGYRVDQVKRIVINGIKGYEKRVQESRIEGGRRLHRTSGESSTGRTRKKLLGKSEWFKKKKSFKKNDERAAKPATPSDGTSVTSRKEQRFRGWKRRDGVQDTKPADVNLKTRTVLFVEQTRDGKLAKMVREVLTRLEPMMGFRVKVVERAGSCLKNILPNTNPWAGQHCTRADCITCNQVAEEKPDCFKRNLVYENICTQCNPSALSKGELKTINPEVPSVYVGETSRSIQERAKEHWDSFRSMDKDSHIFKHWLIHHHAEGEPSFIMKVVKQHRSALNRQVGRPSG